MKNCSLAMPLCLSLSLFLALFSLSSCKKKQEDAGKAPVAATGPTLPGAIAHGADLAEKIRNALAAKGKEYVPRTKHLNDDGVPTYTNRLIMQKSPYLLQHAHNPVNWYPWGDEAFAEAKRLNRPVLISIGYSTCHWCHVMEEESFEDVAIAETINANYIAIKVDREERPDVDSVYMKALQAMGQNGGWPLNVWLTPDREPFFGGTYFPPRAGVRGAKIGFYEILLRAKEQFDTNRDELTTQARKIAEAIGRADDRAPATSSLDAKAVNAAAAAYYVKRADRGFGGLLGVRSKFPSSLPIRFLLRYARTLSDNEARVDLEKIAAVSLDAMRSGGIYDQVGGGFHRYSVDPQWIVPHFEKMLYDNALLVVVYLEAFVALGRSEYADVATDVLAYLVREMRSESGSFYSATDADSLTADGHREEGEFFVWTTAELKKVLPAEQAELAIATWGVSEKGNFEGKNNFRVASPGGDRDPRVLPIRDSLLATRSGRSAPLRDEKILAAWNGLVLSALARAAAVLPKGFEPSAPARGKGLDFAALARESASFIIEKMVVSGRLRRAFKDGEAYGTAFAEDYAFVIAGLIELFEATGEPRWLKHAVALQDTLDKHYRSPTGAYFKTADDGEKLLTRELPARDGAIPSANSVAALNLLRLYELTSKPAYLESADKLLSTFAEQLLASPASLTEMLIAVDFRMDAAKEIVLTSTPEDGFGELESVIRKTFVPRSVVVRKRHNAPAELEKIVPLTEAKTALGGEPTAFVCEQSRCELPTSDPAVLAKQLAK